MPKQYISRISGKARKGRPFDIDLKGVFPDIPGFSADRRGCLRSPEWKQAESPSASAGTVGPPKLAN
jgi:hypothetical protein